MYYMKLVMDAPIAYDRAKNGYYYDKEYNFVKAFLRYWSSYMDLPKDIFNYIYADEEE
jgi:hypothetical protein